MGLNEGSGVRGYVRVAGGWDEVYTAVHPRVRDPLLAVNVDFLLQVLFILVVDELHDGLPAAEKEGHGMVGSGQASGPPQTSHLA